MPDVYSDPKIDVYLKAFAEWQDLVSESNDWFMSVVSGNSLNLTSDKIRAIWDSHGCVRCYFETIIELEHHLIELRYDDKGGQYMKNPKEINWFRNRAKMWKDPTTRRKDRYYCLRHTQRLDCGAALQNDVLDVLNLEVGHMSWGYQMPLQLGKFFSESIGKWYVGHKTIDGGQQGLEKDPIQFYTSANYLSWKGLSATDGNWEEAMLTSLRLLEEPYLLIANNCQEATHLVLTAFGAEGLPKEYFVAEVSYFHWIQAPARQLRPSDYRPPTPPIPAPPPTIPKEDFKLFADALKAKLSAPQERINAILEEARQQMPKPSSKQKPVSRVNGIIASIVQVMERGGAVKVDGKIPSDLAGSVEKFDSDLLKQLKGKLTEAIRESDWRKEVNDNPLIAEKLALKPQISIDTNIGWVDVDYN